MITMKTAVSTALALFVSGCAGSSQAQIDHPTPAATGAANALVLRTTTVGGIAGLGGPGALPDFSLYRDGRAIVRGSRLTEYRLTPEALQRLITAASDAGLATPRTVDDRKVSDAMYKVITFVTGGRAHTTKIIQAGGRTGGAGEFLRRLDPAGWPGTDLSAGPRPYRPSRLAVLATPAEGTGPAWPFAALNPGTRVGTRSCTTIGGANARKAERVTAHQARWRDHDQTYQVTIRPLLPDEAGCGALTR
jgi:hypothetical protein